MTALVEHRLGHFGTFKNGVNFTKEQMGGGSTRIINVKNLYQDTLPLRSAGLDLVDLGGSFKRGKDDVKAGDVFFVRSSVKRDGVGVVVIATEDMPDATHCGFIIRFRPEQSTANPAYLGYTLRSPQQRAAIINLSGGATLTNLSQGALTNLKVWLPSIDVQDRIASILMAYDDLIEVNRRRVALMESMASGLFEEWFIRFRFPGHETVPIVDTPDGPLPVGWQWSTFGDLVVEVRDGIDPSKVDPSTPYLGLEHLPRRSTTLTDNGSAGDVGSLKLRFQRGDVLFGKIRPYFHKVVWAPNDGVASSDAIIYRPRDSSNAALALAVASSDAFVAMSAQTSNGTKMPRANPTVLRGFPVATDGGVWVSAYQDAAMPMIELCAALAASNARLAASRDLLLPRLVSGQLSIAEATRQLEDVA